MPPDAPAVYLIAKSNDQDVAAIGQGESSSAWNTYVAVDDADSTSARIAAKGGRVTAGPEDADFGGRAAICIDPNGALLTLSQLAPQDW